MKKLFSIVFGLCALSIISAAPAPVAAASPATQFAVCGNGAANFFGIQPWYACLQQKYNGQTKLTDINDLFLIIFPVVESLVKIGAYVAAAYIFFMLITMMVARGNAGKIATAVSGIRDAVIGFVICLISIAIVNTIVGVFVP